MGSHAISTSWPGSRLTCDGSGMIVVIEIFPLYVRTSAPQGFSPYRANAHRARRRRPHLPGASRPGSEFGAGRAPLRFFVDRPTGHVPQAADHRAVESRRGRRDGGARWLVHERHELVREAGHRASDADAADVRAASDAVDPSALGHVALHDRTPTTKFDNAFRRAV